MDIIIMNSKNNKTSDPHRLMLNFTNKKNLKRSDKYVALSNLSIYCTWKNIWSHTKANIKYQLLCDMACLNYSVNHILYLIFKITLSTLLKTQRSDQ